MLESRPSHQFCLGCAQHPSSLISYDDALFLFRLFAATLSILASLYILTSAILASRPSVAAESLVLTDFGACPLHRLCLSGQRPEQEKLSFYVDELVWKEISVSTDSSECSCLWIELFQSVSVVEGMFGFLPLFSTSLRV